MRSGKVGCPYCSGVKVLKGFNDMWTTNPEIAVLLENPEDGYRYTAHSNQTLNWKCPDCNRIFEKCPNKMLARLNKCPYCPSGKSYGEKFLCSLLDQLCVPFEIHKRFEWSDNKEYDFYIPEVNCIVEIHGKQHYTKSDFSYIGGRSLLEEMLNDEYKKELAFQNNILNYVTIDARRSTMEWIKNSIINSNLQQLLNFHYKEVNWHECNEYASSNDVKAICEKYNELKDIDSVLQIFHCSRNTLRDKLKHGAINGWCDYDALQSLANAHEKNGIRVVKTMSKPVMQFDLNGIFVREYASIQQAQRDNHFSHIWDCIVGRRKTAGGYIWKYKEN